MKTACAKTLITIITASFFSVIQFAFGQTHVVDKVQFFNDQTAVNATIITDMGKIFNQKMKEGRVFPATFISTLPDSTKVNERVEMEVRGHFRREYCLLPPLKIKFHKDTTSALCTLSSLKLVNPCKSLPSYNQYLLKEYLVYKMYNLITDKSFRVKLLNINWQDSSRKKTSFSQQAFLIEDVKDLAKRNKCSERKNDKINMEETDRKQMTTVAIFEYMIGNTDWSVSVSHNSKLIVPSEGESITPYPVPYDFDYSGLVNTEYAVPDAWLNIDNVQHRVYRGFPRTLDELNEALIVFKQQKENIYALINNFDLLTVNNKKDMISYLDDFYKIINKQNEIKSIFIDNARRD